MEPPKPHLNDDGTYRFVGDLKTAVGPVPFLTHSFPDILPRAKTIGLLAVPANEAVPSIQGHNVSDILAWKTLMHREGRKANQVWLSSIDMAELIQTHEGTWTFAHGEDPACFAGTIATADLQGKNVSGAVGDNPDVPNAPVELYASPEDLKTAFGKQIRDKFQTAKDDNSALVIFASGRCDASQTIHIDLDTHVSVSQQAILDFAGVGPEGSDIPIVLITPAVFSGGWLVNPHIGRKATISDGKALDLWAKHCGGFFMTWADDLLTTGDTCPLLTADEQKAAPSDLTPLKISLRPLKDEFRAEIQRLLQCQLSKFTTIHSFDTSDSSTDDWETYWSQRLGKSLADWKKKWADLPVVPSDAKCDGLPFLGHAFGGSKSSQVAHLKFLTKLELDTCTGDWDKKAYAETDGMLRDFMAETLPTEKQCKVSSLNTHPLRSLLTHFVIRTFTISWSFVHLVSTWPTPLSASLDILCPKASLVATGTTTPTGWSLSSSPFRRFSRMLGLVCLSFGPASLPECPATTSFGPASMSPMPWRRSTSRSVPMRKSRSS